ncbi:hypothetical protein F383_12177 [Gossypium arboreum]|uniref:Uncharacterized protein n=1 Tax=Gossypium arboreum TaxID=29729 RepID=A0A0B0Q131_GOSAR|nr:hypothetical protein F383_12177 [Gossypium arboreum]
MMDLVVLNRQSLEYPFFLTHSTHSYKISSISFSLYFYP